MHHRQTEGLPAEGKSGLGFLLGLWLAAFAGLSPVVAVPAAATPTALEMGWTNPPAEARLRAYWWWLNGNVTRESITRDLEQMKAKGFGGAVIMDANGASQGGHDPVPHGPTFFSPEWRALYQHALREAHRLGLEMSLNIQSGWNLGGPLVKPEDTVKKLTWSETSARGGTRLELKLPAPPANDDFYRDLCVLAWRVPANTSANRTPLENLEVKALIKGPSFNGKHGWFLANSAPDTAPWLLEELPGQPGEEETHVADITNLTSRLDAAGVLRWDAPPGQWQIARFGFTLGDSRRVSTSSEGWRGYALDVLDRGAFERYWNAVVEPLIADAGLLAGKTLKYLHTDSWEVDVFNWTPTLPEEFSRRRGYDLIPWLPVVAGHIVNSREESDRFLNDFRRTLGDLAADNHYRTFAALAARHGLGIHPESGGPHFTPIDAQQCLGIDTVPMAEFWANSATHRSLDETRFFVKQPASAAHTMGRTFVFAEGFTTVGPHWQETLWDNLKPSFDKALCEGLNVLVWHAFVCSPDSTGIPGQQYFAGTHLNPKVTWWDKSASFFDYLNRCQWLLQQGQFVADALYYYGDHVPNFARLKKSDPAHVLPGFDYDVISAEALLGRASVKDGRVVLPDGMSYRLLVLPDWTCISLPVLRKVKELVANGATVIGPKPARMEGLTDYPRADAEVQKLAAELWGDGASQSAGEHRYGQGQVVWGKTARAVLLADGVQPDCEFLSTLDPQLSTSLDYIHRAADGADIYFVANRSNVAITATAAFRVKGKVPELWNAVTGDHQFAAAYEERDGRTFVPLDFTPCGSWFVIFREPASAHPATARNNAVPVAPVQKISGPWTVRFDPKWGGPASVQFEQLVSWTDRPEPGVKYYSGTATYEKTFELPNAEPRTVNSELWLDLGNVRELAEVTVNGQSCGITWAPPFRVDITRAVRPGANQLEIEVVNFWPNRLIGDQFLPEEQRLTRTNIKKFNRDSP
ncbi:MAG TPA: glycosyl hydrolase, partial [Candidatus Acidoferrum sp.]|nr:glycosyl hydrolase [Candidatus Acidoferrum sp.]